MTTQTHHWSPPIPKPRLRGVLHEIAFFVSLVTGPIIILVSPKSDRASVAIYAASVSALFGASALYHRPNWRPAIRKWLRKVDHSMIFFLIAGTFTPIAYSLRSEHWTQNILLLVWIATLAGVIFEFSPIEIPKAAATLVYVALASLGPALLPAMYRRDGVTPIVFLVLGGVLYLIGAVAYARGRPRLKRDVFGYHEFFHAFVIGAALCHYIAVMYMIS